MKKEEEEGGGRRGRLESCNDQISSIYDPSKEPTMAPLAVIGEDDDEYIDTDTGKLIRMPKPFCGCRTCDHRFPLEMDEETAKVYREARFCSLSYTFISSWCMMLAFATVASAGIIAIGFLDHKLIAYQTVGIILTVVFGSLLPIFVVFWVCLRRREKEIRCQYQAEKNRGQVFNQEMGLPLVLDEDEALAKPAEYIPPDEPSPLDLPLITDEEALAKPAEYIPPDEPSPLDLPLMVDSEAALPKPEESILPVVL